MTAFSWMSGRKSWARCCALYLLLCSPLCCVAFLQKRVGGVNLSRGGTTNADHVGVALTPRYSALPHDDRRRGGTCDLPAQQAESGGSHRVIGRAATPRRTCAAAAAVASAILFSSAFGPGGTPPAWASGAPTSPPPVQSTTQLLNGNNAAKSTSTQQQQLQQQQQDSVVNEVWSLIDKYYIDRTFNNQDWNKVRERALGEAEAVNFNNDKTMRVVADMVGSLNDRYTRLLDVQQYGAIQKFDLIGVGVTLMPNQQRDIIVGAPPIGGSPSALAGLRVGDLVTAVNGRPTRGRSAFDIIDQIGEDPNAKTVTFSILRRDTAGPAGGSTLDSIGDESTIRTFDVTMERQTQEMKDPVTYKISETRGDGTKVGYVRISEFNSLVNSSLQRALARLREEGANAYVVDLRANTGGAFQSAVEISGMFLRDRVATYVVDSNHVELPFRTPKMQDLAVDPQVPVVVWLDGMSASASEVLAGALHDNCRAVTMGDKSFGKGLIQAVYGLKNGAGLVLTVARYITPGGNEIQGRGITPDLEGRMMAPVYVPVLGSDTSRVDFGDISRRLDPTFCKLPEERPTTSGATSTSVLESSD
jgi:carboxyl-terminal processing protease